MPKKNAILSLCIVWCCQVFPQLEQHPTYGFNIGVVSAIGTHQQRFGVVLQSYYVYKFAQVNASLRLYDNLKDLGPKGEHGELNAALGLCLGYGQKRQDVNLFVSAIGNQTGYRNSVAYSYAFWYNKVKTAQVTGLLALQFHQVSFIIENDLLAKSYDDRFRTGAFLIQYQDQQFQYALNCTLWTGAMGARMKPDSLFRQGFMSAAGGVYANLSHGLLSAQVKYANEYGQYLQANMGVDAEQVRNVVQNKVIHDLAFIPSRWYKSINAHIPMIDREGGQYLYRNDQRIRKPRLLMNGYTNPDIFY